MRVSISELYVLAADASLQIITGVAIGTFYQILLLKFVKCPNSFEALATTGDWWVSRTNPATGFGLSYFTVGLETP